MFRRNPSAPASTTRDVLALRPGEGSTTTPLVVTEQFEEAHPAISRDCEWLAYTSNEAGRVEVFVRPFPDVGGGKWQVSSGGGRAPLWAHNGRELFFLNDLTGELEVAEFTTTADAFVTGRVTALFSVLGPSETLRPYSPQNTFLRRGAGRSTVLDDTNGRSGGRS